MPKRTLEDTELASEGQAIDSKKERKEKRQKSAPKEDIGREPLLNGNDNQVESKEARQERKRLKKLKKLQESGSETPTTTEDADTEAGANGCENGNEAEQKAAKKAARKAEKAKLKAAKRAQREEESGSGNNTPPALDGRHDCLVGSKLSNGHSSFTYIEDAELAALPQSEIDKFLAEHFITTTDPLNASINLRPILNFSYLPISDPAQREPFKNFKAPTPIQSAAWPFLLSGRDVIGVAETGSGKTMAFAVPCVRYISTLPDEKKNKGPKAVVVSPTRELAMQSHEQITKLATASGLQSVCVYGGVPKDEQRKALKTADIVVATPGRLNDLINEGCADLSKVVYVVLDEADRMLDKGFEEEIRRIINNTPPLGKRQTLMFTATWPESVRELAATFMTNPVKIAIGDNPTGDLRANARIVQKVEVLDPRNKEYRLMQLLKQYQSGSQKDDRILVFCLYKKEAMRVEGLIRSKGFRVAGIHGDLSQEQRTRSLEAFKQGKTPILVATDVAARGLDIPAVKLVLNVTYPLLTDDYVHRIGRTGRAGKDGLAITFFTEHDKAHSGALINVLKAANQVVPDELLKFGTTVKKKGHEAYGAFFKDVDNTKAATKIRFD